MPDGYLLVQAGRELEYLTGKKMLNAYKTFKNWLIFIAKVNFIRWISKIWLP